MVKEITTRPKNGQQNTTYTVMSASYLNLDMEIDNEGWLKTKLRDKSNEFSFQMVYLLPLLCELSIP